MLVLGYKLVHETLYCHGEDVALNKKSAGDKKDDLAKPGIIHVIVLVSHYAVDLIKYEI